MEDPKAYEESYFWHRRQENGWPPVPESVLREAETTIKAMVGRRNIFAFCGVPVQELTEREAKAALVMLMRRMFDVGLDA